MSTNTMERPNLNLARVLGKLMIGGLTQEEATLSIKNESILFYARYRDWVTRTVGSLFWGVGYYSDESGPFHLINRRNVALLHVRSIAREIKAGQRDAEYAARAWDRVKTLLATGFCSPPEDFRYLGVNECLKSMSGLMTIVDYEIDIILELPPLRFQEIKRRALRRIEKKLRRRSKRGN